MQYITFSTSRIELLKLGAKMHNSRIETNVLVQMHIEGLKPSRFAIHMLI